MGYTIALWQNSIWYKWAWSTTLKSTFDGLVDGLLNAGTFGWLWPRQFASRRNQVGTMNVPSVHRGLFVKQQEQLSEPDCSETDHEGRGSALIP